MAAGLCGPEIVFIITRRFVRAALLVSEDYLSLLKPQFKFYADAWAEKGVRRFPFRSAG
jgi:hypothetical protein